MKAGGLSKRLPIFIRILAIGMIAVLPFQNCGVDHNGQSTSLFLGDNNSSDCLSTLVDCGAKAEYLEIILDMQNPTTVILANAADPIIVDIAGRCNTGNYPEHNIRIKVTGPTGTLYIQKDLYMACVKGRFNFTENLTGIATNAINTLQVEMIGIENGTAYVNFLSTGRSTTDLSIQVTP